MRLQIHTREELTPQLKEFRAHRFSHCTQSSIDCEADIHSRHVVVNFNQKIVGYGRLTDPAFPLLEKWSNGKVIEHRPYNGGSKVCCQLSPFQNALLYRLIILEIYLNGDKKFYKSALRPGKKSSFKVCEELHYKREGRVFTSYHCGTNEVELEVLTADVSDKIKEIEDEKERLIFLLNKKLS